MTMTYVWAYLAGMLTLINPCVLPLLPITIAAALQSSRLGPMWLAGGLVASFVVVGVGVTAFGHLTGIDEAVINRISAVMMMAFGVVLLLPRAQEWLARLASPLASGANARIAATQPAPGEIGGGGAGHGSQFFIGVLLGAVWSPCIGPTLGGAIGLAASGEGLGQATVTMLAFGAGVSSVLMALAYGSREVIGVRRARMMSWMPWAKPVMGVVLLVVGAAVYFHWLRDLEVWLLDVMPVWLQDLSVAL
jgi:cytochrome c biogenesis protein CcdA